MDGEILNLIGDMMPDKDQIHLPMLGNSERHLLQVTPVLVSKIDNNNIIKTHNSESRGQEEAQQRDH